MTQMKVVEPRLKWFVGRMRRKLAMKKNVAKSDWRENDVWGNLQGIESELEELRIELEKFSDTQGLEAVIDECADVANRAMMLADQCRPLASQSEKEKPHDPR